MITFALIAAILLALVVTILRLPSDFIIQRSLVIAEPASAIFPEVNDFHRWESWSPWAKLDPDAATTFEGADQGVGAVMKWDGNASVGAGSSTIIESESDELIRIRLDFLRPFKGTNISEFSFLPEGAATRVTWTMTGQNSFIGKIVTVMFNCKKMIAGQFDQGLAALKDIAEAKA